MMADNISICYIDDTIDSALEDFLYSRFRSNYHEIKVTKTTNVELIFEKIREYDSKVIIIDSKLFEDSSSNELTGEIFELLALARDPKLGIIIVSQNDDVNNYKYIKKVNSHHIRETLPRGATKEDLRKAMLNEYEKILLPHISFFINKAVRMAVVNDSELKKTKSIDNYTKEIINNNLNNLELYNLSQNDLDKLFKKINEIADYVNK